MGFTSWGTWRIGRNGDEWVGSARRYFCYIKKDKHHIAIKYFFVFGKNDQLKQNLQLQLEQENLGSTALKRTAILGLIDENKKNELLNICSLFYFKTGWLYHRRSI